MNLTAEIGAFRDTSPELLANIEPSVDELVAFCGKHSSGQRDLSPN